jgi:hypothetical protein
MTLWTILRLAFVAFCLGFAVYRYRTRQPKEAISFLGFALSTGGPALPEPWDIIVFVVGVVAVLIGVLWNPSPKA